MTQWDLDTTEATMGSADVTWQLDDLDVWDMDEQTQELCSALSNFNFYRDMTNRMPLHSPPKSPGKAEFNASVKHHETSVESFKIDSCSLN